MHFGFALSGRGPLARPDALVKLAEAAEGLRYASVFVTDSTYPSSATGRAGEDWLLGSLADATSRIRLGTSVQDIRAYQALGVTHVVFEPAPQDLRGRLAMMERFAEDVRPKVLRAPR